MQRIGGISGKGLTLHGQYGNKVRAPGGGPPPGLIKQHRRPAEPRRAALYWTWKPARECWKLKAEVRHGGHCKSLAGHMRGMSMWKALPMLSEERSGHRGAESSPAPTSRWAAWPYGVKAESRAGEVVRKVPRLACQKALDGSSWARQAEEHPRDVARLPVEAAGADRPSAGPTPSRPAP